MTDTTDDILPVRYDGNIAIMTMNNPKRLNAVPWTPFCIECQELADRAKDDNSEMFEELMVA